MDKIFFGLPLWGWGAAGVAVVGGYYLYNNYAGSSSDSTDTTDTSGDLGSIALQPPISSGGVGGVDGSSDTTPTTPDSSPSSIDALTQAIQSLNPQPSDQVQLAQIDANAQGAKDTAIANEGSSVFQTLASTLTAQRGLGRISANVPGLGNVSVWRGKPTNTVIKKVPVVHTKTITKTIKVPTPTKTPAPTKTPTPTRTPAPTRTPTPTKKVPTTKLKKKAA